MDKGWWQMTHPSQRTVTKFIRIGTHQNSASSQAKETIGIKKGILKTPHVTPTNSLSSSQKKQEETENFHPLSLQGPNKIH